MSTTRAAAILVLGMALGVGIGWALSGVAAPPAKPKDGRSPSSDAAAAFAARVELEQKLASEHAARVNAEARTEELEKALAAAKSRVGSETPAAHAAPRPDEAAVESRSLAARKTTPVHPGEILARVRELDEEAEAALKSRDGKKLLEIVKEASALGKDAWPLLTKLGSAVMKAWEQQEPAFKDIDYNDTNAVFAGKELAPLYEQALKSTDTDADFRRMAASYFRWTGSSGMMGDDPERVSVILDRLGKEEDESVASILAWNVPREARFADGGFAALAALRFPSAKLGLASVLTDMPGDEVTKALANAAATEADPAVKRTLELGVESRKQQPVSGFFVTYVYPKGLGDSAGLLAGDILTSYAGVRIRASEDLGAVWQAMQGMKPGETVPVAVYRNGASQQVSVGAYLYSLGILGRMVHSD